MPKTKNSQLAVLALSTSVIAMPVRSFQVILLNPLTPVLNKMFNETYQNRYDKTLPLSTWTALLSVTSSAVLMGATLGAISMRLFMLRMSRKRLLQVCHILSMIGAFLFSVIGKLTLSYEVIIVARVVSGFAIGIGNIIVPITIAEICTREQQSFWQSISASTSSFGSLLGVILMHSKVLGTEELWPIVISLTAIPNIIFLLASLKIPNTPFYLARQGNKDKTIATLQTLRIGTQKEVEKEYDEIIKEICGKKTIGLLEILKTKQYRKQFICVFCLFLSMEFNGKTRVIFYSDSIFRLAGIASDQVTNVSIGLFSVRVFVSIFGLKVIRRYSALKVLLISILAEILALILFTVSQATTHLASNVMPYVSITAIFIFLSFFSGGFFIAVPSIATAVTIEPTRSTILGVVYIFYWITAWLVGFISPYLEIVLGAYSFTPWIGCTIFFCIYFMIFVPETNGRSIEQIQRKLSYRRFSSASLSVIKNRSQTFPVTIS